jgi:hypothetical protein
MLGKMEWQLSCIPWAQRANIHGKEHFTNTPLYKGKIGKGYISLTPPPLPVKHKGGSTTFEVWKEENNIELKYGP